MAGGRYKEMVSLVWFQVLISLRNKFSGQPVLHVHFRMVLYLEITKHLCAMHAFRKGLPDKTQPLLVVEHISKRRAIFFVLYNPLN